MRYVLGFDEELTCKRVHRTLGELIEQKRYWMDTKFDNEEFIKEREETRMALPVQKIRQIMCAEEYERLGGLEEKVKGDMGEEGYKLLRNTEEGRILVGKNGMVRTQSILKGTTAL
mgnify:CR=1 FL=1